MKKAALSINQSFQHQTFALMPSGDRGLQVLQGPRLRGNASTAVVTPAQPETCKPDCPTAQSSKASMNSDAGTESAPTPLAAAIARNDIDTLKALIKAGTDLRPANWYDTPVLVSAALFGHLETVQLLLSGGADVNTGYEQLPIHAAAQGG
ncbi:MAG: ankyrin repeat domain-containing protein, partial [Cyanobacteria bacterium J06576_12]